MRHPAARPITRPSGSPTIVATELPVTIMPSAIGRCSRVTRRVASGAAIDQKIECAQATMMRAPSSTS